MRPISIPIRSLMPEPTDAVEYMAMPREMTTFEMPRLPEPGPDTDVAGARDVLDSFVGHMSTLAAGRRQPARAGPGRPASRHLRVLNETLGEGEVSAIVEAGHEVRVQETVFSGVWREQHLQGTHLLHDYLLAAPIPPVVQAVAQARASTMLRALPLPAGAMNVPALVNELQEAMDRAGPDTPAHVINLTLLPLSPKTPATSTPARRRLGGGAVARFRQLPHQQHGGAQCLARAVLQQHADADPQHH
jgi:hydrogenase-1 operon protein HyaF